MGGLDRPRQRRPESFKQDFIYATSRECVGRCLRKKRERHFNTKHSSNLKCACVLVKKNLQRGLSRIFLDVQKSMKEGAEAMEHHPVWGSEEQTVKHCVFVLCLFYRGPDVAIDHDLSLILYFMGISNVRPLDSPHPLLQVGA